ncbi:helix-turn-helix transcriptional regulator [Candidatus Kaiserbacteria bacterium]|nr:helix-turn-helix transcriptional regulator [Candidatus Kaiserbacteria bacterium]
MGDRLRSQRLKMGLTQEQLGIETGTNQAVIQKIENGKSLRPRKINEIASILQVDPGWLMFGEAPFLSEESISIAKAYDGLTETGKQKVKDVMGAMME